MGASTGAQAGLQLRKFVKLFSEISDFVLMCGNKNMTI